MNAATHRLLGRFVWLVTGLASVGIGLHALGLNLFALLHLCSISLLVQYGLGLCGVASVIMFFVNCCGGHCGSKKR